MIEIMHTLKITLKNESFGEVKETLHLIYYQMVIESKALHILMRQSIK